MCQAQANRRSTGFFQAIGDWLGIDGSFGYDGPTYGALSANNWGRAFTGAGAAASSTAAEAWDGVITVTAPARRAVDDFWAGWNTSPVRPYREASASAAPAYVPVISEGAYRWGWAEATRAQGAALLNQRSIFNSPFENFGLEVRAALYDIEGRFQRLAVVLAPVDASVGRGIEAVHPFMDRYQSSNALATTASVMVGNPEALAASLGPRAAGVRAYINYGALDDLGRPTGVDAMLTADLIGTGTPASQSIIPPGWSGNGLLHNEARGHLLGAQLGGSGDVVENLVTLQQNPANSPFMRGFEGQVRAAVESGEVVHYTVTPIYNGSNLPPRALTLSASGSDGYYLGVSVLNPPGY
jgi:hypothetical protein